MAEGKNISLFYREILFFRIIIIYLVEFIKIFLKSIANFQEARIFHIFKKRYNCIADFYMFVRNLKVQKLRKMHKMR